MLGYLTLIFCCQLVGELIVGTLALPIPGPVVGMVLLFALLLVKGRVPAKLGEVSAGLLGSMSLLFVPAGTGVMLHFRLLGESMLPLSVALLVSTVAAIAVTGVLMAWLGRGAENG